MTYFGKSKYNSNMCAKYTCQCTFYVVNWINYADMAQYCNKHKAAEDMCSNCGSDHDAGHTCCTHCAEQIPESAFSSMCPDCSALSLEERVKVFDSTFSLG